MPQDYVWPGEESAPKNQHGSKAGKTSVSASLHDRPGWNKDMKYSFETVARSDDIGMYYGGMVGVVVADRLRLLGPPTQRAAAIARLEQALAAL